MPRLNTEHPAEEFLFSNELISRRSVQRRALLGCIGCRWLSAEEEGEEVRFYGRELANCTGIKSGVVYPILNKLEDIGVITGDFEEADTYGHSGPPRKYYYPDPSELGQEFFSGLSVPEECALEIEA